MSLPEARIETLKKLELQTGDVLVVKVGGPVGKDLPDWVPSAEDLLQIGSHYMDLISDDVGLLVTHHLVKEVVIRAHTNMSSWPPVRKVMPDAA